MRKLFNLPLYYLVLAAGIGLLLRWNLTSPVDGLNYRYWLHAHSHVMFLGWVFNFFNLVFLYNAFGGAWRRPYRLLFMLNQFLIVGMLIFFPQQGYGSLTIPLSVAHTVVSAIFCIRFILDTRYQREKLSRRFAVWSLILFLISSLGPFALGPIMMQGLGQSKWYYFAIYFYLHFQYNGVFLFGVLSLLSRWCENNRLESTRVALRKSGVFLFVAAFPTYALSLLWSDVPLLLNWVGFIGAALQVVALVTLSRHIISMPSLPRVQKATRALAVVVGLSFVLKLLLQVLSALPAVAKMAYVFNYYVIAYLHLVLIGVITLSMFIWYIERRVVSVNRVWIFVLLIGFIVSELIMVLIPSVQFLARYSTQILFSVSIPIFAGFAAFPVSLLSAERKY